jgi:hypothetical protein
VVLNHSEAQSSPAPNTRKTSDNNRKSVRLHRSNLLSHEKLMKATELIGRQMMPAIREKLGEDVSS